MNLAILTPRNTFKRWRPFLISIQKIQSRLNLKVFFLIPDQKQDTDDFENISNFKIYTPVLKHTALEVSSLNNLQSFFEKNKIDWVHIIGEPSYFHTYNICKLKETFKFKISCRMAQNVFQKWPFPFSYIEQFSLKKLDVIFPVSSLSRKILENKKFRKKIQHLNNGVDQETFTAKNIVKKYDLLYVGKLLERKGVYDLAKALRDIKHRKMKISFCISGGEVKKLDKFLKLFPKHHDIEVYRNLSHEDLSEAYNSSKFLIAPSKYSDGSDWSFGKYIPFLKIKWLEQFSMVAAESMSCGVPVIHTKSGALPEVVNNPMLMAEESNHTSLKKVIEYAMGLNHEEYREMCIDAQSKSIEYQWDKIALKLLNTIKEEI